LIIILTVLYAKRVLTYNSETVQDIVITLLLSCINLDYCDCYWSLLYVYFQHCGIYCTYVKICNVTLH